MITVKAAVHSVRSVYYDMSDFNSGLPAFNFCFSVVWCHGISIQVN